MVGVWQSSEILLGRVEDELVCKASSTNYMHARIKTFSHARTHACKHSIAIADIRIARLYLIYV